MRIYLGMAILLFSFFVQASELAKSEDSAATQALASTESNEKAIAPIDSAKANLKESDIVLNLEPSKKAAVNEGPWTRIMFSFGFLIVIAGGAYVFLKKYSIPQSRKSQTQIKVIQQHFLGPKKSLAIVRVAGESILIGVTDQNISLIKSLSLIDDEVPEETPIKFADSLKKADYSQPEFTLNEKENTDREEFSFAGIKDVVSKRIKEMRSID